MKKVLKISGMHCTSCNMLLEDVCSEFSEIKSANADFEKGELTIEYDSNLDIRKLVDEIHSQGDFKVQ